MTNRERIIAALRGKETDRLPFSPLICPYFIKSLPLQGYNFDIFEVMKYIGIDIIERHVLADKSYTRNLNKRTETRGKETRTYFDTPVGTIFSETCQTEYTSYVSKHLISCIEEAKIYQYIAENTEFSPDFGYFQTQDKRIGDYGIATPSGPITPLQDMLQYHTGIENTVYMMADYPEEMNELLATMHERNIRHYKILAECPCEAIIDYEDTSTTVMSKSMYSDYSAPMIDDYADILHSGGKIFITHMCGKLSGFAKLIGQGKMDGIDSVCPPTTGDLWPWDARSIFGEDKVIIGGIEPPSLSRMSVAESLNTVIKIIKNMPNLKSFILSTGDAVPYGTPINNLIAISRLIKALGPASLNGKFREEIVEEIIAGM